MEPGKVNFSIIQELYSVKKFGFYSNNISVDVSNTYSNSNLLQQQDTTVHQNKLFFITSCVHAFPKIQICQHILHNNRDGDEQLQKLLSI